MGVSYSTNPHSYVIILIINYSYWNKKQDMYVFNLFTLGYSIFPPVIGISSLRLNAVDLLNKIAI